jgi:hypothetical protein
MNACGARWAPGFALALALSASAFASTPEERASGVASRTPEMKTEAPGNASEVESSQRVEDKARRIGLDLSSDAPFRFKADSMDVVPDKRKLGDTLQLRGNVTITRGELKLTCDRLDAVFPQGYGQGSPQKFIASGDVHVVNGESELHCTHAEFEGDSCIATCLSSEACGSGKWPEQPARYRSRTDSMEGRKLQFNQCTGQVTAVCGVRGQIAPRAKPPVAAPAAPAEEQP